jgi:hypothetical protein
MYGTIAKPSVFEEYVSLNQLDDIEEPENTIYYTNGCNVAACVLVSTSIYGVIFYIAYYVF